MVYRTKQTCKQQRELKKIEITHLAEVILVLNSQRLFFSIKTGLMGLCSY